MDDNIFSFKGVPYGGNTKLRRFQPPLPPTPWRDTLDATHYGAICPQTIPQISGPFFPDERQKMRTSEDCLNLNIWTPALRDGAKRPVLVYFHGGGFVSGSGNNDIYNGTRLCKRGNVVVVTVNHRLNLFGYLYLAAIDKSKYAESGNVGMLDLILALQWVRDNIAEFGGDPDNVTIFGESGGGGKCATLMAMPQAHGLFHKVITQSGQQVMARTIERASETTASVLQSLGIDKTNISALDSIQTDKLVQAIGTNSFAPVKDNTTLTRDPFEPDAPAISKDVPMMLGVTHDEMRYLIGITDTSFFHLTWDNLLQKLEKNSPLMGGLNRSDIIAQYKKLYPAYNASDVFFASTTASRGWRGLVIESERRVQQHGAPTYVFQLRWKTPVDGGKWKAPHTLDIPLVFDNIVYGIQMTGTGSEAQAIADMMSEAWVSFARNGNPDNPKIPHWEPFNLYKKPTMIFDTKPVLEYDPLGKEMNLFLSVPYIQPGTR
jgi:para-nitrobenzyl esterase